MRSSLAVRNLWRGCTLCKFRNASNERAGAGNEARVAALGILHVGILQTLIMGLTSGAVQ